MNTISVNGATPAIKTVRGKRYVIFTQNTFGGGSLALEASLDGTNFSPVKDSNGAVVFTSAGDGTDFIAPGNSIRLSLSGATAPSINYEISPAQ